MTEDKPLSERPLHIRVAEALGLGPRMVRVKGGDEFVAVWTQNAFYSDGAHDRETLLSVPVPRFDTSWAETGPLIEKYGITLAKTPERDWLAAAPHEYIDAYSVREYGEGAAYMAYASEPSRIAATPLEAVCRLLLALAEAGKLEER